jgi:diguanylate cyclase (GGDEF)-like protein
LVGAAPDGSRARHARVRERVTWSDVFAVREFRGLFAADLISTIGDQLAKVALAILIYDRTHSAFLGALTYAVALLPAFAAGPLLGWLADRRPRRGVMISCDLARLILVAIMVIPGTPSAALLALLFAVSFLDPPFKAARAALLPDVLAGELYPVGQSVSSVTYQVAQVLGFGVGGALVAILHARGALAVDAATFALSAVIVRVYSPLRPAALVEATTSRWALMLGGAEETLRRPELRRLLGLTAASFGLIVATEGLGVSYADQLGHGAVATGLLTAAVPVGAAIGLPFVTRIPQERRLQAIRVLGVVWALPLIATFLRPPVWAACVLWALTGVLGSFQLLANVQFARALRTESRGRVFAFAQSALVAVQGAGLLLFGAVARFTTPSQGVGAAGIAGLLICGYLALRLGSVPEEPSTGVSSPVDKGRYPTVAPRPPSTPPSVTSARGQNLVKEIDPPAVGGATVWRASAVASACALIIALIGWALVSFGQGRPFGGTPHMSWWLLTIVFTAFGLLPLHFQKGDSSQSVIVSQLPLMLGLFFASPGALFTGCVVGLTLAGLASRSLVKILVSRATSSVEILTAVVLFHLAAPGSASVTGMQLLAAALAVVVSDGAGFMFLSGCRQLVQGGIRLADLREPGAFTTLSSFTVVSVGLLAVVALASNSAAGVVLVAVGLFLRLGFRTLANLQERHTGLGKLYALQEQMGALVPRGSSLFPVLHRTRALLLAGEVVVDLPEGGLRRVIRIDEQGVEREYVEAPPDSAGELWSPPVGLSVPLKDGDLELGFLRVGSRLGRIRGFNTSDLHLLETLAAHVSDALQRGTLIERLHDAATHDPLTGLNTLNEFMRLLDEELIRGRSFMIALLNVSRLKDINDSLGHQAGDALLQQVSRRLLRSLPADALLGRAGGGEFAIAIPGLAGVAAADVAEGMVGSVSGLVQVLDVTIDLRSRVGWLLTPEDGQDAVTLVRRADLALSQAKSTFQAQFRYSTALDVDGRRRLRLVNDLRRAISDGELRVVYQPLVAPDTAAIIGFEALCRWTHEDLGIIPPEEFVAVAEQSGMISDLTDYVLGRALAQIRRWTDDGHVIHVAVNLSARCLTDMSLPGRVLDMLAAERLSPTHLTLEVTETSVAEDPTRALAVLQRLRSIGVRLSIDDFGTGYSSLASLKNFPVHEVKLDRGFLKDLDVIDDADAESDMALLAAIVALGHSMHLDIVAEGVETPQAYRRLRNLGIDILQGYYFGRPSPPGDVNWTPLATQELGARRSLSSRGR